MLLIVDTEDTKSPELLVAPNCNHEAVEGAHRSEEDQSDEPCADRDQLLRTTVSTSPPERFRQLIASKLITLSKVDKTNIILIANN